MSILDDLIKKYQDRISKIINPDGVTWIDFGLIKPAKGYDSIDEYIRAHEDFDEGQQTEIRVLEEVVEDLTNLKNFYYGKQTVKSSVSKKRIKKGASKNA